MSGPSARVVRGLDDVDAAPSVATIGNFDGVHLGHRHLLQRTVESAAEREVRAVVLTFDPHPAALLRPGSEPAALTPTEERIRLLAHGGVDLVVVLPFTRDLSRLTPADFVERVLVERLRVGRVLVGANFRFGHGASGDVAALEELGASNGFDVESIGLHQLDDVAVSSSAIRAALSAGDVELASRALGRPFTLRGEVVAGDGRGRSIGVPTANVAVPPGIVVPADGVYAGHARVSGRTRGCVTNVGVRPTLTDGSTRSVEVHLLDVDLDLYGAELEVSFLHRLRGEARFDGVDALVDQIRRDVEQARELV